VPFCRRFKEDKMHGGAKTLLVTAALATVGCAPGAKQVEIRPIADPAAKLRLGGPRLAQAKAQLALGNVGLALEAFRIVTREQPSNTEALAGLAACYSTMGRFDLARQYYEAALAISPNDPALLTALAASLDSQGMRVEAAEVRAEVSQLQAASAALDAPIGPDPEPAVVQSVPVKPAVKVISAPLAVAAPIVQAMPAGPTVTVKLPPARPAQAPLATAQAQAHPVAPRVPLQLPQASVDVRSEPSRYVDHIPLRAVVEAASASVTVALLPARPVQAAAQAQASPPRAPLHLPPAVVDVRSAPSPHLERLSPGVVALITQVPTAWRPQVVARTAQATTVRWVPLREASARPNIRLLNAARHQGLAARTRDYLLDRGWRKIAIGDASEVRATSVVYYPSHRQGTARSLAAQFGFRATQATKGNELVVLLGRDATARRALQTRG
jgi:hypothetical protein